MASKNSPFTAAMAATSAWAILSLYGLIYEDLTAAFTPQLVKSACGGLQLLTLQTRVQPTR